MNNFFRKIRKEHLSQTNMSKYAIYAIGEIFLVVIGILIALQINNWNTARIANQKMTSNLASMKQDLIADTLAFSMNIALYTALLDKKREFLALTEYDNIPTDTIAKFIIPEYSSYDVNTTTFTKITNLGLTEISRNDSLSGMIYTYYTLYLKSLKTFTDWEIDYTNIEANFWVYGQDKYELRWAEEVAQFQDNEVNRRNLIEIISSPKGRNHLLMDYERKQKVLMVYQHMHNSARELIEFIELEL